MIGPSPAQFGVCFDLLLLGYWEIEFSISSHVSFILRNVRIVYQWGSRLECIELSWPYFLELFEKSWGIPNRHRLVVSVLKWSNDWMIWGIPILGSLHLWSAIARSSTFCWQPRLASDSPHCWLNVTGPAHSQTLMGEFRGKLYIWT